MRYLRTDLKTKCITKKSVERLHTYLENQKSIYIFRGVLMIVASRTNSKNDEYYTPVYAVKPIIPHLKPNTTIWCPFDTEESNYVKVLRDCGFTVVATHIKDGHDFFETNVECDYIISNPPYSKKTEVLERLFTLGKPFAMLVGVVGLFDSKQKTALFRDKQFEILYLTPRVSYFKSYAEPVPTGNPPYQSVYVCSQVLPKQIEFTVLDKTELK